MEAKVQITPQNFSLQVEHHFLNGKLMMRDASEASQATAGRALSPDSMLPNGRERVALFVTNTTTSASSASAPAPIAYRMLTTDRKRFTVSPREGILPVGETHTIIITLNSPALTEAKEAEDTEKEGHNGEEGFAADDELERFLKELAASAKRTVEVQRGNGENSSSPLHETRFIGKASFKLEYRGLFVSTAEGSNGDKNEEGFPDDTAAVAAIAAGAGNAPSISDLIKAGGRRLKKSAVMDCTTVHCIIIHDDGKVDRAMDDGNTCNMGKEEGAVHAKEEAKSDHGEEDKEENAERRETERNVRHEGEEANTVVVDTIEEEKEHFVRGEHGVSHQNVSCDACIYVAETTAEHNKDGPAEYLPEHSLLQDGTCDASSSNSVPPYTSAHPSATKEKGAEKQHNIHEHTPETKGRDATHTGESEAAPINDDDYAAIQQKRERGVRVDRVVSVAIPLLCVVGAVVTAAAVIKKARKGSGGAALLFL